MAKPDPESRLTLSHHAGSCQLITISVPSERSWGCLRLRLLPVEIPFDGLNLNRHDHTAGADLGTGELDARRLVLSKYLPWLVFTTFVVGSSFSYANQIAQGFVQIQITASSSPQTIASANCGRTLSALDPNTSEALSLCVR